MNKQEIFTEIVTHLLKQNAKAMDEEEHCMYRGSNGTMCAVGCLIPDELYNEKMEGDRIGEVLAENPKLQNFFDLDEEGEQLLRHCQSVHDGYDPEDWKKLLEGLAKDFDLKMP